MSLGTRLVRRWRAAAPALGLLLVGVVSLPAIDLVSEVDRGVDAPALGLVVVAAVALSWRDTRPRLVLTVAALCTSVYLALGYPYGSILFCLAVAVYALARHLPTPQAAVWCAGTLLALLVHVATSPNALPGLLGVGPASAWVVLPATAGIARRLVLNARAREQAERDTRLLSAQRLRLAHDVHDIVGHGLAAIHMQADIALHLRESRPAQAYDALQAISWASAHALTELRTALTAVDPAIREPPEYPSDDPHTHSRPGLADLPGLRERMSAAGISLDIVVSGMPILLPAVVDVVAYRVLQESLTNVAKHAQGAGAQVSLDYGDGVVHLQVTNQAPVGHRRTDAIPGEPVRTDPNAQGLGLSGMHRRVQQAGGTLTVRSSGNPPSFTVDAILPLTDLTADNAPSSRSNDD